MNHKTKHHFMRVLANSSMLMIYFALLVIPVSTIGLLGVKYSYSNKAFTEQVLSKQDTRESTEVEPKDLPSTAEGSTNIDKSFDEFSKDLLDSFETTTTE